MKSFTYAAVAALASTAIAAPLEARQASACASAVTLTGNAFAKQTLHANSFYRGEVEAAAEAISDSTLKAKALKVADIGSFIWMDTRENIGRVEAEIPKVPCGSILGVVVYDLPGRDCAAKASNGELAVGQINVYKTEYIDRIVKLFKAHPNVAIAAVIEPDSLPNLVTNSKLTTCQNSASGYREGVAYALKSLNLPNVVMYIDAGHGGWLGWNDNLKPGAKELADVWKKAGSPKQVMGIATNVAGWNAWSKSPGEFEGATDAQWNKAQDEKRYIDLFAPELKSNGMPNHAIIDTGRNGKQGLRKEWGHWCNVKGAGFGTRPTGSTGHSLVDAFVWVKPGGESDGTSDSSATRFDAFCGYEDAYQPSPEAGSWHQAYFEELVANANPPL